jgi:hypothetical protein
MKWHTVLALASRRSARARGLHPRERGRRARRRGAARESTGVGAPGLPAQGPNPAPATS